MTHSDNERVKRARSLLVGTSTTVGRINDGATGVYIGRPRTGQPWGWGNPFSIGEPHPTTKRPMSREDVLKKFEHWLATSPDDRARWMRDNAHLLRGRHLQCFCKPQSCHGDILAKYAEEA